MTLAIKRVDKKVEAGMVIKREMIIEIDTTRMIDIKISFKIEAKEAIEVIDMIEVIGAIDMIEVTVEEDKEIMENKGVESITNNLRMKDIINKGHLERWVKRNSNKNKMKNIDFILNYVLVFE